MSNEKQQNVLGAPIGSCCINPITGFYRDGFCHTGTNDRGMHTVCVEITWQFLEFSKEKGNDLMTPRPQLNFPGLKEGDHWCLCAARWLEAYKAGKAPRVNLNATNIETLAIIPLSILQEYKI
jgi:uncharacterized protein